MSGTVLDAFFVSFGIDTKEMHKGGKDAEKVYEDLVKKSSKSAKAIVAAAKGGTKEEIEVAREKAKELMAAEKKAAKAIKDNLVKEAREATEKIKEQKEKGKEFFKELATSALEFFGILAAAAGMAEFIHHTVEAQVEAGRLAKTLDADVEEVEALQGAAKRFGGTAEGMSESLKGLNSRLQMIAIHGPRSKMALQIFAGMGISAVALKGKDATQVMGLLAEKMEKMSGAKAMALGERLGLDEGTIRLLQTGKKAVAELTGQIKKHVSSDEDIKKAEQFEQSMIQLQGALAAAGREIMSTLMPALQAIGDVLVKIAAWIRDHSEVVKAAILGIAAAFLVVNGNAILMGINAAIAWFMATWPIALLVAAIALVAAGLYLLITHIKEVGRWFNQVAYDIAFHFLKVWFTIEHAASKMWKSVLEGAKHALGWIWDKLKAIGSVVLKVATFGMAGGASGGLQPAYAGGAGMAMRPSISNASSRSTSHRETNINGPINIHTQATDAQGIAKEIPGALRSNSLLDHADGGF